MSDFLSKARKILADHYIGAIATIDSDGSPRSTPLHIASDDEYVYWLSKPNKVHSQNIDRDGRVFVSLASPSGQSGLRGVYLRGRAEHLSGDKQKPIYQLLVSRIGRANMPPNMDSADAYRLRIGSSDEQKSTTNCWYFYS
ncbi:MAG: pyridoxamine 5'-phosphate oxidase family protein [bacterium]|nr:pyridoxamine 5'-phosphate oxidase family protein [bacterium]MDN5835261.1 pyridoxamine 5'-phosphate oxidase family protein [bacterium]